MSRTFFELENRIRFLEQELRDAEAQIAKLVFEKSKKKMEAGSENI